MRLIMDIMKHLGHTDGPSLKIIVKIKLSYIVGLGALAEVAILITAWLM